LSLFVHVASPESSQSGFDFCLAETAFILPR